MILSDILFYKAFDGTDTIYAGESGDWRFAFPVKMFSLSYTDDNGDKWISAMKSAGYLYMSYKDGDPTLYGPVKESYRSQKATDLPASVLATITISNMYMMKAQMIWAACTG